MLHSFQTLLALTYKYRLKLIAAFVLPDLWPLNSPDLNPVDYKIWGIVQQ